MKCIKSSVCCWLYLSGFSTIEINIRVIITNYLGAGAPVKLVKAMNQVSLVQPWPSVRCHGVEQIIAEQLQHITVASF